MTTAPVTSADDTVRFPSLASLRAAHSELLKRYRATGDTPETSEAIQTFIQRGRATGALLDAEADRWTAQTQLDYWATQLFRPGQAPLDATLNDFDPSLAPELDDALCPYLGLDAFHEKNQQVFFGRRRLTSELIKQLKTNRWLSVLGSSGSGKSSVVRAGLIPALERGAVPGSESWFHSPPMVPGSHPLANLARLILPPEADAAQIEAEADRLRQDPVHLTNLIAARVDRPVVLVIDQFEEVFTLCTDDVTRRRFVDNLIDLCQTPTTPHCVIITMRTDFETHVARLPNLQAMFEQSVVRVTPLNAAELREAIEAPAALIGLKFEEGVVDALLNDTLGEPAALPLLQFTLLKLWESREHNRVTWEAYKKLGGGRQALARSADELYDKLIPEEQVTMRRILLKMVKPGKGLEVTSNRVLRAALYQKAEANDRIDRVLDRLIKARLVRVSEGDTAADEQVEVAHEALVRNWPRLVEWLDEERVTLRQRQRLTAAAEQWARLDKDPSAVWRGVLLEEARRYDDLNELETDFIRAGRAAEEAARRTVQNLQVTQRGLRRARWIIAGMVALGLLALLMLIIFRPTIYEFSANADTIPGGSSVTLKWSASPITSLTMEGIGKVDGPNGSAEVRPRFSQVYQLNGYSWLSSLLGSGFNARREVLIRVEPVLPIVKFQSENDRTRFVVGEIVRLSWQVERADTVTLSRNGLEETVTPMDTRELHPDVSTVYVLNASNPYGRVQKTLQIEMFVPTPTPLPPPEIVRFDVQPRAITIGDNVNISWEVANAPFVQIQGIPGADAYPPKGNVALSPDTDTDYMLIASNGQSEPASIGPFHVTVNPATSSSQFAISSFVASPPGISAGQSATLSWIVKGVRGVAIVPLVGVFPAASRVVVDPMTTTVYTLVASDGKSVLTQPITVTVRP